MNNTFHTELKYLNGVGEVRAKLLSKELELSCFGDLLYHFPHRYIDRTRIYTIRELPSADGTLVQFRGRIASINYVGEGSKSRLRVVVRDTTGAAELIWFKGQKWIEKRLEAGREYLIFGRVSLFRDEVSMVHPEVETIEKVLSQKRESAMQGVYSSTEKVNSSLGAKGIYNAILSLWRRIGGSIEETLPQHLIQKYNLISLQDALYNIHFPQSRELLTAAEFRLKFEELFGIQLNIQSRRTERLARANGSIFNRVGDLFTLFYNEKLPFPLTAAQKRVIKEIRHDTTTGFQMNRLLQGDVGSGKTVVSLCSMLLAVDNGYQATIMAPTEILARQHYASMQKMCEGLPISIGILTGSSKVRERRLTLEGIASGEINILIGTHALLEERVQFQNLGFVVIDEQHRFGVEQRAQLWKKNSHPPHILVMTATPIPRTLAMTLYGDLDVSIIDELPPGRKPIKTVHYTDSARLRLIGFMREQIELGRQVYVVYPLIKESEGMDYKDLTDGFEAISRDFPLPKYRVAICHGKMKAQDKEESMRQFKEHEADIMISTTVIEVGVDVPNATLMVIESAERFGLSQLHQLRGRVGRGAEQSYCILMSNEKLSNDGRKRLEAMCETNDGFRLSELDLQLRGAGDVHGTQQSGEAVALNIANPTRDIQILTLTRDAAIDILDADPSLSIEENTPLRELRHRFSGREKHDFSMIS